jgi:hypothetical protein
MTRKNLYDILKEMDVDIRAEYCQLFRMVFEESCVDDPFELLDVTSPTFAGFVDSKVLKDTSIRGTSTNLFGLISKLNLPVPEENSEISLDNLLLFCEVLLAVIAEGRGVYSLQPNVEIQAGIILENINKLANSTGHYIHKSKQGLVLLEKNPAVIKAAESTDSDATAECLLEYGHRSVHGNLKRKRQILTTLASEMECYRHDLESNGFRMFADNLWFMLNNMNIRHNNTTGKAANLVAQSITEKELEQWYDSTFSMLVTAVLVHHEIPTLQNIENLKGLFKKGKDRE